MTSCRGDTSVVIDVNDGQLLILVNCIPNGILADIERLD
jgi:hypothetical protein